MARLDLRSQSPRYPAVLSRCPRRCICVSISHLWVALLSQEETNPCTVSLWTLGTDQARCLRRSADLVFAGAWSRQQSQGGCSTPGSAAHPLHSGQPEGSPLVRGVLSDSSGDSLLEQKVSERKNGACGSSPAALFTRCTSMVCGMDDRSAPSCAGFKR